MVLEDDFKVGFVWEGTSFPLLLQPKTLDKTSSTQLEILVKENKDELTKKLLEHGAILIRGFNIKTALEYENVIKQFTNSLDNKYYGTSPRVLQPGCKYVFSASEFPWFIPIPQHCEISFTPKAPKRISFCCLVPPSDGGGETPLADFEAVYRDIKPEIREKWERKGLLYLRSYPGSGALEQASFFQKVLYKIDPFNVKSWEEVFQTKDSKQVEQECKDEGYDFEWVTENKPNNQIIRKSLRLRVARPPSIIHPVSKKKIWFNHAHIFDFNMIPREYDRVKKIVRENNWKIPFPMILVIIFQFLATVIIFLKRLFQPIHDLPTHIVFADDSSEIPSAELEHVRDVIWKNKKYFKWEQGDVVILDNQHISHGRMPYKGKRSIIVSWFGDS